MMRYQLVEAGFLSCIAWAFVFTITCFFLAAALMGMLLLEAVNYIEHYGLTREKVSGDA